MLFALVLGLLLGQSVPAGPAEDADLSRIRKALAESPPAIAGPSDSHDGPVFRVLVRAPRPDQPVWHDSSMVPLYVRPSMPPVHYEFLQQVTPEYFRASVLYPGSVGVPVVPLFSWLGTNINAEHRRRQEQQARDEVRRALEAVAAARRQVP